MLLQSKHMKLIMPSTVSKVYLNILNYNGWADTIECLESVLRNDYPNYQVIFDTLIITRPPNKRAQKVDETYEIAQKYGKNVIKDRLPREAALSEYVNIVVVEKIVLFDIKRYAFQG